MEEIPNPKSQIPNKFQTPNSKEGAVVVWESRCCWTRGKAALKRPHSPAGRDWRVASDASCCAERLECGRFSAAVSREITKTPQIIPRLTFGTWSLEFIWDLGFGIWSFPLCLSASLR